MAHIVLAPAMAGDVELHEVLKVSLNITGNAILGNSLENVGFTSPQAVKWLFEGKHATDAAADVSDIMTGNSAEPHPE